MRLGAERKAAQHNGEENGFLHRPFSQDDFARVVYKKFQWPRWEVVSFSLTMNSHTSGDEGKIPALFADFIYREVQFLGTMTLKRTPTHRDYRSLRHSREIVLLLPQYYRADMALQ